MTSIFDLIDTTRAWDNGAICASTDPEIFFPGKGGNPEPAKALCRTCPSQATCLQYALDDPSLGGVWGGTTGHERELIRRGNLPPIHGRCHHCRAPLPAPKAKANRTRRFCDKNCYEADRRRRYNGRCHRGHKFTPENTYIKPNGTRECRACARLRREGYKAKKGAAA